MPNHKFDQYRYPTVNFIGNKEKIADWIYENIPKDVESVFDAFSGGASVSFNLKRHGLKVIANDIMRINHLIAKAIIENASEQLTESDLSVIFSGKPFKGFVYENFANVFFFPNECMELDLYRKNIDRLSSEYKKALAYALMRRSMIRKMPYSRFNIKWEKVKQLRDEEYSYSKYKRRRAYHNKSFEYHFRKSLNEYNGAIFDNNHKNIALNADVMDAIKSVNADLIYLDPPYTGTMNNYYGFYSFLDDYVNSKISRPFDHNFIDKKSIIKLFDELFSNLNNYKYWMLSYNSASFPSKEDILKILKKYAKDVKIVERKHTYKINGRINKGKTIEYLFIAERRDYDNSKL